MIESTQDYDSIQTAVNDMEAKIMEKVSMLTLDSLNEVEEPTEVSFTAEDITDLTEPPASTTDAPSSMTTSRGTTNFRVPSPIRPRAFKRTMTSISTTPMTTLNDTEESTAFQDLSILLLLVARNVVEFLPIVLVFLSIILLRTLNQPQVSPFGMYDKRLDGLVNRLTTRRHEIPSLTLSPSRKRKKSMTLLLYSSLPP